MQVTTADRAEQSASFNCIPRSLSSSQNKMEECGEMSPGPPPHHSHAPSQTPLPHTQLMLTGSQLAGVRQGGRGLTNKTHIDAHSQKHRHMLIVWLEFTALYFIPFLCSFTYPLHLSALPPSLPFFLSLFLSRSLSLCLSLAWCPFLS